MKKIIQSFFAVFVLSVFLCLSSACIPLHFRPHKGTFVAVSEVITEFLTENNFSYTEHYTEEEGVLPDTINKKLEYSIQEGEASAELILFNNYSTYECELRLTDPTKNVENKIYLLLDLLNKVYFLGSRPFTLESLQKEVYLSMQISAVTVYKHYPYSDHRSHRGFRLTMTGESYQLSIIDEVNEEYTYQ